MPKPSSTPPPTDPSSAARGAAALQVIAFGVVVALLYVGREVLVPFALAILLAMLLDPGVQWLIRRRLPRVAAVVLVLLCAVATLGALSSFVTSQLLTLSQDLPQHEHTLRAKLQRLKSIKLSPSGLDGALDAAERVGAQLSDARPAGPAPGPLRQSSADTAPVKVQIEPAPSSRLATAGEMVRSAFGPLAMAGVVLVFVVFILLERNDLRDRLLRLSGRDLRRNTETVNEASRLVKRYLQMQWLVNLCYGVPLSLGLWWLGVPGWLLWGLLGSLLRFVPYLGPAIAAVFPLTMAFAVDPGWNLLLWTAGLILVLELVSNNLLEPWLYGSSTGLAPVAILLSALFWTALWGPVGLVLATPLTAGLVVFSRQIKPMRFLDVMLSNEPVFTPAVRLYQRLLASDASDALDMASREVAQHGLPGFCGGLGLEALRVAAARPGPVEGSEARPVVCTTLADMLDELEDEAGDPPEPAIGAARVHCIGLRSDIDAASARLLADALRHMGVPATHANADTVQAACAAISRSADAEAAQVFCLCTLSAAPGPVLRMACRRLRRQHPQARIVAAVWDDAAARQAWPAEAEGRPDLVSADWQDVIKALGAPPAPPAGRDTPATELATA